MKYERIVGPASEPVTLAEVKAQLRLDIDDDDALLKILIATARENYEATSGRLLLSQTVRVFWDWWPYGTSQSLLDTYPASVQSIGKCQSTLFLPLYPARLVASFPSIDEAGDAETVAASTRLRYIDENGALQVIPTTDYTVDYSGKTPRAVLNPDVDIPSYGTYPNAIQFEYVCGTETAADVPADSKQALLLLITMLYERREDMKIKGGADEVRTYEWLQFSHRSNLV